jgi:hypothetical protein
VATGRLLFVSGHDPEADGRLVYRGRVGRDLSPDDGAAAVRLATANALASAVATAGGRARLRRCLAVTCFVDAGPAMAAIAPRPFLDPALSLIRSLFGSSSKPVVWLRGADGLAGGMPVEVELLLELVELAGPLDDDACARATIRAEGRRFRSRGAGAARSRPSRSGRRTS